LGLYLALVLHAMHGDAYSRVTNASYALFSRDPHLAAIGFVWPPLPTLFELPFVALKIVWPPMLEQGVAAVIMSAVFMAAAVHQLSRALVEFAVPSLARFLLVAAFALHPMIVYYGVIGTSEAPTVFFLLLTVRHLARWVREPAPRPLVMAGLGLAGAYLTRYEAMFSALGVAVLVGIFTLVRTEGRARARWDTAVADVAIVLAPFVLAFVGWALASWLIVGSPFPQFTSSYGNTAQINAQGISEQADPMEVKAGLALRRLGAADIALPSALGLAVLLGRRRRDHRWSAVLAGFGPALAFLIAGQLTNTLFPWLRFFILAIPMSTLLMGLAISGLRRPEKAGRSTSRPRRWLGALVRGTTVASIVLAGVLAIPVAVVGLLDPTIAVEESRDLAGVLGPGAARDDRPGADLRTFATEREIARYVDGLQLPPGSVLVDVFSGFAIVAQSAHPRQFVITPDPDFRAVLADPQAFGVRYLLVPARAGNGLLDALNTTYPTLASDGAGFANSERSFAGRGGSGNWELYRVGPP